MKPETILQCEHLTKRFRSGEREITVLADVSFSLCRGETCAVMGPSGSGKTTLLTLAAGLDRPSYGRVILAGQDLAAHDEDGLALLRGRSVGFVFQSYQLLPSLTALENVALPLEIRGRRAQSEAELLLERVGLAERRHHYPSQLSGGEQQRVALARAFVHQPLILFADEPTGSLDRESAEQALAALFELNRDAGVAVLLVTHDRELGARMGRSIELSSGHLASDNARQ
jgi:putative ABC transport system ATP-binding protein